MAAETSVAAADETTRATAWLGARIPVLGGGPEVLIYCRTGPESLESERVGRLSAVYVTEWCR